MSAEPQKTLNKKITPLFKKAALMATFCFAAGCDNGPPSGSTPLTKGEADLVHSVFGDQVDTTIVGKYFKNPDKAVFPGHVAETFNERKIVFYGAKYASADYSRETTLFNYGDFMHEMTHIWQRQTHNWFSNSINSCHEYAYPLELKYTFNAYCDEQQAAIVEDYSRHFLHLSHGGTRNYERGIQDNFPLLQKVVEDQFPQARKTRLALEAQERTKIASARSTPDRAIAFQIDM